MHFSGLAGILHVVSCHGNAISMTEVGDQMVEQNIDGIFFSLQTVQLPYR